MSEIKRSPVVLLLLDGWGISQTRENNAIRLARIPQFKDLVAHYPATVLSSLSTVATKDYAALGFLAKNKKTISQLAANNNLRQLKIAETLKFPLVSVFFNRRTERLINEDWKIIPGAGYEGKNYKLATEKVLSEMLKALKGSKYDFIFSSWPNIEVAGRSGDLKQTIKALEFIDKCLVRLSRMVLDHNGTLIITSAYGKAETMTDMATGLINKELTMNPVPLLIIGDKFKGRTIGLEEAPNNDLSLLSPQGKFENLSATILKILGLIPEVDAPEGLLD